MAENKACGREGNGPVGNEYEIVKIRKTDNICPMCEDYAKQQASKPIAIMSCEGGVSEGRDYPDRLQISYVISWSQRKQPVSVWAAHLLKTQGKEA